MRLLRNGEVWQATTETADPYIGSSEAGPYEAAARALTAMHHDDMAILRDRAAEDRDHTLVWWPDPRNPGVA